MSCPSATGHDPQNEPRSLAGVAEVRRRVSDKPIRHTVNTHHHAGHTGGLRIYYVAQSATVVTHEANHTLYDDVVFHPGTRTIEPDLLSWRMPWFAPNPIPSYEPGGDDGHTLTDGERVVNIYPVLRLGHVGTMLIVHVPAERILDQRGPLLTPPRRGPTLPPPSPPTCGAWPTTSSNSGSTRRGTWASMASSARTWTSCRWSRGSRRASAARAGRRFACRLGVARHVGVHGLIGSHVAFMPLIEEEWARLRGSAGRRFIAFRHDVVRHAGVHGLVDGAWTSCR